MPFRFKVKVLDLLKEKGYTTYLLKKENLLSSSTITKLRNGDTNMQLETIDQICRLLNCLPKDIIEYIKPEE